MMEFFEPTTPGDILLHEFMQPLELSAYRVAKGTGLSQTCISQILKGKRSITADTSIRLARYFGLHDSIWLEFQAEHDVQKARTTHDYSGLKKSYKHILHKYI